MNFIYLIIPNTTRIEVDGSSYPEFTVIEYAGNSNGIPSPSDFNISTNFVSANYIQGTSFIFARFIYFAANLANYCILSPWGNASAQSWKYWLVVPCDLLSDAAGQWGISPTTFYSAQHSICDVFQGNYATFMIQLTL